MKMRNYLVLMLFFQFIIVGTVLAQKNASSNERSKNTTKEVVVTSNYKPSLIGNAKWLFSNAVPIKDSTLLPVNYQIPAAHLAFQYIPQEVTALAINRDTTNFWNNHQWVKVGAGNFHSFLGALKLMFGSQNLNTVIEANSFSAKGKLPSQEFQFFQIASSTIYSSPNGHEWNFKPIYESSRQYFYGDLDPTFPIPKEQIIQKFSNLALHATMQNSKVGNFGLSYQPQLKIARFYNDKADYENAFYIQAPLQKKLGKHFQFGLSLLADYSNTTIAKQPTPVLIKNSLYSIEPSIHYFADHLQIKAGITPTWNNQAFETLHHLSLTTHIGKSKLMLEAGLLGQYAKNSYRSLFKVNPYLNSPNTLPNTRKIEQYLGISNQLSSHLNYRIRASLTNLENQPLFVNAQTGKGFDLLFEPSMRSFKLTGEIMYRFQEKISILTVLHYNQYHSLTMQTKPWGLVPLELSSTISWAPTKDFHLQTSLFAWDGSYQLTKNLETRKLSPAADMNLEASFSVLPKLNLWLQMNNIFNNTYQRWNNYQVLGFQILGGVVYSFR